MNDKDSYWDELEKRAEHDARLGKIAFLLALALVVSVILIIVYSR